MKTMKTRKLFLLGVAALVAGMQTASATPWTWLGNTDANTGTDSNWSPAGPLTWNLDAIFGAAGSSGTAINWNDPYNIGSITFNSTASAYTMTKAAGFQFTSVGVDSIANNSGNLQTFSSEVRVFFNGSKGFNANTANLSLGAVNFRGDGIVAGQSNTLTLTGSANGTIGGTIQALYFNAGTHGIIKTGSGTWTLNGNNTYSGTTTVSEGTLTLGHTNALGTSAVTVNGGTLNLDGRTVTLKKFSGTGGTVSLGSGGALIANITDGAVNTFAGAITGTGNFTKDGNGGFALNSSNNSYTGDTIIKNNWLQNNGANAFCTNGVLRFGSSETSQLTFNVNASQTFAGVDETGTINNTNPKIVQAATPQTLTLNVTSGSNYTFYGYVRNVGTSILTIIKNGTGTQVFSGSSGQVTYTGATTINGGVLEFSGIDSVANNSAITLSGGSVKFSGGGTRTGTIVGTAGSLIKAGANTLTLGGANSYAGSTVVEAGTLKLGTASAVSNSGGVTMNGGVLDLNGFAVTTAFLDSSVAGPGGVVSNGTLAVTTTVTPGGSNTVGSVTLPNAPALSGTLWVDVASSGGTCDQLKVTGNLSVTSLDLRVVDANLLNKASEYTIAQCTGGSVTGSFLSDNLPYPWKVYYQADRIVLKVRRGTVIRFY